MKNIFKRGLAIVLSLSLLAVLLPQTILTAQAASAAIFSESFEDETSLEKWAPSENNTISISDLHAKLGDYSACWAYSADGSLTFTDASCFAEMASIRTAGIIIWIYNDEAKDENITFTIGTADEVSADTPRYRFTFNLNFTGWRTLHIRVAADGSLDKTKSASPDTMRISMPEEITSGQLFIDLFEVKSNISFAYTADYQAPYLSGVSAEYEFSKQQPDQMEDVITASQISDFDIIESRLDQYVFPEGIDFSSQEASPLKTRYQKLVSSVDKYIASSFDSKNIIREEDGRITGTGLFSQDDERSPKFSNFETAWIALLADYKLNGDETSKEKLLLLFDYFADQGWAFGSALGTLNHQDNRTDGYAYAVYVMRDELAETGRLEREIDTLGWYSLLGIVFDYDPESPDYVFNTDSMRTSALYQLMCILAMEDSPEKVTYMKYYVDFMNRVIMPKAGLRGGIKPDGTVSHHNGVYMAGYGSSATYILSQIAYLLHGTQFELSEDATGTLVNVLTTYYSSACDYSLPYGVRGRFPNKDNTLVELLGAYAFLTLCGDPNISEQFLYLWDPSDPAVSSAFKSWANSINYTNTLGELYLIENAVVLAEENGYSAKAPQDMTLIKPYGGYMIHRKDNWMLSVKGYSKYVWDYESDSGYRMGRYNGYGSTFIFTDDNDLDNVSFNSGWNWTRWPGTTTIGVSNENLIAGSGSQRNFSKSAFLGGVSSENNGIYAMELQDKTFDSSFSAKKSWFCFGDEIVCIGSGIENTDETHNTETTLFQTQIIPQSVPLYSSFENGEAAVFPTSYAGESGQSAWMLDPAGNGYIIPDASGLTVEIDEQSSVDITGKYTTSGNYATAYINHGRAPSSADYQYIILPQTTMQELKQELSEPSYSVAMQNDSAHIVTYNGGEMIGYAVYESDLDDLSFGALRAVSGPCVVLEEMLSSSDIIITISDPDLRVVDTTRQKVTYATEIIPSQEKDLTVTLNGLWNVEGGTAVQDSSNNTTTVTLSFSDGEQRQLKLSCDYSSIDLTISKESVSMLVGEEAELSVQAAPSMPANSEIVWSSSDESIVTVDGNGLLKAIAPGSAEVKAELSSHPGCFAVCSVAVQLPELEIVADDGTDVSGDTFFVKLPSIFSSYKNTSVTLGISLSSDVEIAGIEWSYANWSQTNPEATIAPSSDGTTAVITPNGKGIGARSVWVTASVTDIYGNVYSDTIKVRFYKFDWQK